MPLHLHLHLHLPYLLSTSPCFLRHLPLHLDTLFSRQLPLHLSLFSRTLPLQSVSRHLLLYLHVET